MDAIMQGTTPALRIAIRQEDFLLSNVVALELYIKNSKTTTYTMEDVTIDTETNKLTYVFTEEETAELNPRLKLEVQARFWFADHSVVGINKIQFSVADMLGVGV